MPGASSMTRGTSAAATDTVEGEVTSPRPSGQRVQPKRKGRKGTGPAGGAAGGASRATSEGTD